jgi:hypothetical protein
MTISLTSYLCYAFKDLDSGDKGDLIRNKDTFGIGLEPTSREIIVLTKRTEKKDSADL